MSRVLSSAARAMRAVLMMMTGLFAAGASFAGTNTGSIHFTAGTKSLSGDWFLSAPHISAAGDTLASGRSAQPSLGVELTWGRQGWPVSLALDVLHSYDDGLQHFPLISLGPLFIPGANVQRRGRTIEIGLGARRSWLVRGFSPTIGAGGTLVRASVSYRMSDPSQGFGVPGRSSGGRDAAFGYWVGGGLYRNIGPRVQMGLRARYSKAKLTLPEPTVLGAQGGYYFRGNPREVEAGGRHIALVLGWSFPGRK